MTEIIFKKEIGQKKLNSLLDFIKSLNLEAEVVKKDKALQVKKVLFTSTRGMWKDSNIDANSLRSKAWSKVK